MYKKTVKQVEINKQSNETKLEKQTLFTTYLQF